MLAKRNYLVIIASFFVCASIIVVLFLIYGPARGHQSPYSSILNDYAFSSKSEQPHYVEPQRSFLQTDLKTAGHWYGIRNVPLTDIKAVSDNLGGMVINLVFQNLNADQITAELDQAHSQGFRVLVRLYESEPCSRSPWSWNGETWEFSQLAIEVLRAIAHHPAVFAIYALHEPFDTSNECHWTIEQQQDLYRLLKLYTAGQPVWTDIGTLSGWEERGIDFTDGICDYCGTFHHRFRSDWTSEECLSDTLASIDADLDTQRRLMPTSQVVFNIQAFSYADYDIPFRLPTAEELKLVRDHLCSLGLPMFYYPWDHGTYDLTLKDTPQLWPVVVEGCRQSIYLPLILANLRWQLSANVRVPAHYQNLL